MRFSFVEMEGFRGVRAHLRIGMPDGFLVITGRNGSGKSTVCDAIEFALTGVLSKYEGSKERGESTEQYLWWRGTRSAERNFVRVGVRDDSGREFTVTRTPAGTEVSDGRDLAGALCDLSVMTRDPIAQLCRTAIIRDETVAAMSIDLAEEQRFTFVRTALGTDALDDVARRGKEVLTLFKKDVQAASAAYERARESVTQLVTDIARARSQMAEQMDVGTAEATVRQLLGQDILEPARLLAAARQHIATARRQQETLLRVSSEVELLQAEAEALDGPAAQLEHEKLAARRNALARELEVAQAEFTRLEERAAADQAIAPVRSRIATLYEAGRAIGRRHDTCPLCATPMDEQQFAAALTALAREVAESEREAASVQAQLVEARQRTDVLRSDLTNVESQLRRATAARAELTRRFELLAEQAITHGALPENASDATALRARVRLAEQELETLSSGIAVLEASAELERVVELERQLQQARDTSDGLEAQLRQLEAAEARAKRLLNGVRRAVGEVVEERLAALDPLLKDLYGRLRPHADWTELNYTVRGELRKFLSLRVGDEVNPRFTFSSGQRRAIGLAFLLAVHLSRPWCRLGALVLDDPIQHIDDFRSLHLVEVLGAIRKAGQQIICAVEDEELADLMCRRIRSGNEGEGRIVRMAYRAGDGATMQSSALVAAPVQQLIVPWHA